jgi:hypothetical protein
MKRRKLAYILFAATTLAACGQGLERASYRLPHSNVAVVIERSPAHSFLAEYERRVELNVQGNKVAQSDLLMDTGGYSRANLYQISETVYLIRDADASYLVDTATQRIKRDEVRRRQGAFLGSFDVDSSKTWRFIPAGERPELPTEFSGG